MPVNPLLPMELSDGTAVVLNTAATDLETGYTRLNHLYGLRAIAITTLPTNRNNVQANMVFEGDTGRRCQVPDFILTLRNVGAPPERIKEVKYAIDLNQPVETETGVRLSFVSRLTEDGQVLYQFSSTDPDTALTRDGSQSYGRGAWYFYASTGHYYATQPNQRNYVRVRNVGGRVVPFRDRYGAIQAAPMRKTSKANPSKQQYNPARSPLLRSHGGGCCGASHILGFSGNPSVTYPGTRDTMGGQFEAAITVCRQSRAAGRIEIILKRDQVKNWEEFILERGFRKISTFINSNTSNTLTVYEYCYGVSNEGKTKAPAPANPFGK